MQLYIYIYIYKRCSLGNPVVQEMSVSVCLRRRQLLVHADAQKRGQNYGAPLDFLKNSFFIWKESETNIIYSYIYIYNYIYIYIYIYSYIYIYIYSYI